MIVAQLVVKYSCLWNTKFHNLLHKGPQLDSVRSQFYPVHTATSYFFISFFLPLHLDLQNYLFPSGFPTVILYAFWNNYETMHSHSLPDIGRPGNPFRVAKTLIIHAQ
jgi:hypothetical protein